MFLGSQIQGIPSCHGADAVGEEEAVDAWEAAVIPEDAYTEAIRDNNNWTVDNAGNPLYVVGLWDNLAR